MVYLIKSTECYYENDNELKRLNLGENLSGHLIQPNSAVLRYPSVQFGLPQVMFAPCSPWKAFHGLLEPFVEVSGLVSYSPPSSSLLTSLASLAEGSVPPSFRALGQPGSGIPSLLSCFSQSSVLARVWVEVGSTGW